MKKLAILLLICVLAILPMTLTACNKTEQPNDTGTGNGNENDSMTPDEILIAFSDIEMVEGESYSLPANVIISDEERELTYTVSGSGVKVEGGKLVAVNADTQTTVSATASGFSVNFKVKVVSPPTDNENTENSGTVEDNTGSADNAGGTDCTETVTPEDIELALSNITMNVGERYSLPENVIIDGTERALTYIVTGSGVKVEGGKLVAIIAGGENSVLATADGFSAEFSVTVADYGKLTISDVLMLRGTNAALDIVFSNPEYESDITYTFDTTDGTNIRIKDGEVTGILPNTVTVVVAQTPYHTEVFTVTVVHKDLGKMSIDPPTTLYSNYPAKDLNITFADDRFASAVTYEYDCDKLFIEDGKIYAKGIFASPEMVTVTASSLYDSVTFTVNISTFDNNINAEAKVQYYEDNHITNANKGGIIFVGDSYFDGYPSSTTGLPPFWSDFYTDYADEKAFLMGISQSMIDTLEVVSERLVYPMEPSEIVVHIGFNDVHHSSNTPEHLAERIIALVEQYKERLPDVKVYFIGVEPKKNGYTEGNQYYYSSTVKATALTELIKNYAETSEWFTYVDTLPIFINDNGTINTSSYLTTDQSHPTLEAYDRIREKINEARGITTDTGGDITDENAFYINNLTAGSVDITATGKTYTAAGGGALTGNYVIRGKLCITDMNYGNAHLQFRFSDYRFLLWDSNSDGKLGAGYMYKKDGETFALNDTGTGVKLYDATSDLTLEWAVVVNDGKAYWYINGELVGTFDAPTLNYFNIGALQMNAVIYDVELTEKAEDADAYSALLEEYGVN